MSAIPNRRFASRLIVLMTSTATVAQVQPYDGTLSQSGRRLHPWDETHDCYDLLVYKFNTDLPFASDDEVRGPPVSQLRGVGQRRLFGSSISPDNDMNRKQS